MRMLLHILSVLAVMGLAFWAYRENYRTQSALSEKNRVRGEIARLHDDLAVLRAEWAFLNRPERLRDLVALNFDRLKLVPMDASQFIAPEAIDYAKSPPVTDPGVPPALADDLIAMDPAARAAAGRPPLRPNATAQGTAAAADPLSEELPP